MGYACPVCETPQRDGEHLANHLAFTAMLRGGDHEAWLDDRVPAWAELEPSSLADRVADHATEATYDEVFEDTTDDHGQGHEQGGLRAPAGRGYDTTAGTEETEQVLAEARRLTAEMHGEADDSDVGDGETGDGDETAE